MEKRIDVDTLWDQYDIGFDKLNNPYYKVFQKLYQAGADLYYIVFCLTFFTAHYTLRTSLLEDPANQKKGSDNNSKARDYRQWSKLKRRMLFETIQKTSSGPPSYQHKALTKWVEDSIIDSAIRKAFIKTGILLEGPDRKKLVDHVVFLIKLGNEKQEKKDQKEVEALNRRDPERSIFREYLFPNTLRGPHRVGRRGDLWGTFFLLAITEHLRKKQPGKPNYSSAAKLLDVVQADLNKSKGQFSLGRNAMMKIKDLKKSHPKWKRHLHILEEHFFPKFNPPSHSAPTPR